MMNISEMTWVELLNEYVITGDDIAASFPVQTGSAIGSLFSLRGKLAAEISNRGLVNKVGAPVFFNSWN